MKSWITLLSFQTVLQGVTNETFSSGKNSLEDEFHQQPEGWRQRFVFNNALLTCDYKRSILSEHSFHATENNLIIPIRASVTTPEKREEKNEHTDVVDIL